MNPSAAKAAQERMNEVQTVKRQSKNERPHSGMNATLRKDGVLEKRLLSNRRTTGRHGITLCNVLIEGEVTPHRVSITNMTRSGLQIRTQVACQVGARVKLHLPGKDPRKATEGVIRYACRIKEESGPRYAYGVEFESPGVE